MTPQPTVAFNFHSLSSRQLKLPISTCMHRLRSCRNFTINLAWAVLDACCWRDFSSLQPVYGQPVDKSSVPLVTPQKWYKAMKLPATKKGDPPNRKYMKIDPYEKALAVWKPRPPVSPGACLPLNIPFCNLHSMSCQTR